MQKKKEVLRFLNESLEKRIQEEVFAFENAVSSLLEGELSFFLEKCPSYFQRDSLESFLVDLKKSLKQIFDETKKELDERFFHLNSYLCEVIPIILENPFVSISKLTTLKEDYLEKMNAFFLNTFFKKKVSNEMAIFVYQISIVFHLHQNVMQYQILRKFITEFETHFFTKSDLLFSSFQKNITVYFDQTFGSWFEELEEDFYCVQRKNVELIQTYAFNQLKERTNMGLLEKVKKSFMTLKAETIALKKEMYTLTNKKDRNHVFLDLQDYLLSYHNMIYHKICSLFDSMNEIVFLENHEKEDKVKTYQEFVYKITEMNFQLDQKFIDYTSYYMNFFSKKRYCEQIESLRSVYQEKITSLLKEFTWNLLRSYLDILNEVLYREKMILLKTEHMYVLLENQVLKDLWKKVK